MRIIIDSLNKRMTIPVIDYLVKSGFEVHGICFDADKPLNLKKLKKIHYICKNKVKDELKEVFLNYTQNDILIAGDPIIIENTNIIKPNLKYLLSSQESINKAANKKELQMIAESLDIVMPKELAEPQVPMIVKLNISENMSLKPAQRYRIIKNETLLIKAEPFMKKFKDNLILQEYVDGISGGVSMLLDDHSNIVDYIVHERILEYPVSGGPSAACKSIQNEELVKKAYKLLKALNWKGIAMVEFKGNYLIEINPRFWGSMPLLFVAKSNFFRNYINILQNQYTIINTEQVLYKINKTMHFFPQGILSVMGLLKTKKITKAMVGIKSLFLGKEGIFRFNNPAPFFKYLISLVKQKSQ